MREILYDGFIFYKKHFGKITFINVTLVFPLLALQLWISNYFYVIYEAMGYPGIGLIYGAMFSLVTFSLIQLPFIRLALQYWKGEIIRLSDAYKCFLENMFSVYIMSLVYVLLIGVGTLLFIVPGLLVLIVLFAFPYTVVVENKKGWSGWKCTMEVGKKYFFKIMMLIVIFGLGQWMVELVFLTASLWFTDRFIIVALIQMGLSMIFLPLFVFIFTSLYLEWIGADIDYFAY